MTIELIYQHQHQQQKNFHFFNDVNQNKKKNNKQIYQQIHYQVMIIQGKRNLIEFLIQIKNDFILVALRELYKFLLFYFNHLNKQYTFCLYKLTTITNKIV